jgi:hypothetical protein
MPQPDWRAIFTLRPELAPPGYDEAFLDMAENPRERPARGTHRRGAGKAARFPDLKHKSD